MWEMTAQGSSAQRTAGDEEARIMELARSDPAAFAPLYERYFPRIYAYCLRRAGNREEAEDLSSLVFTRALGSISQYRGDSVPAWLFQIAHNAIANHWRGHQRKAPLETAGHGSTRDETHSALHDLIDEEDRRRVAELIAELPEGDRELLRLRVGAGLSAREVGQIVGKSEGAIWVALHRITKRLRAAYQRADGEVAR